jgi:hypothetical protein
LGPGEVEAKGPATGTVYTASEKAPDLKVDQRDAGELMKSGQFMAAQ